MRRKRLKYLYLLLQKIDQKELTRLLRSLNNSANSIKTKIDIYLGIERGAYSKLKILKI